MVPTPSSLAAQLDYLDRAPAANDALRIELAIGDYEHAEDRLWLRHAGTTKPLWARANGADTKLIGLSWHRAALPIYASARSGIVSARDLRGRRIALARVVNQSFDVERAIYAKPYLTALQHAGLGLDDVEIVDVELEREHTQNAAPKGKNIFIQIAEASLEKLSGGAVDAIAANLSAETVREHGLVKIYDGREDPDPDASRDLRGLVASGAAVREHRDALVHLVSRLIAAGAWAREHPEDVLRHFAADLALDERVLRGRGLDPVEMAQIDCTAEQIAALERKQKLLRSAGLLERDAALEDWIDASILREARALPSGGGAVAVA
jgi:ABC-type nitrate/sulfonate/bicarbonate transport system substrate-binding protein